MPRRTVQRNIYDTGSPALNPGMVRHRINTRLANLPGQEWQNRRPANRISSLHRHLSRSTCLEDLVGNCRM